MPPASESETRLQSVVVNVPSTPARRLPPPGGRSRREGADAASPLRLRTQDQESVAPPAPEIGRLLSATIRSGTGPGRECQVDANLLRRRHGCELMTPRTGQRKPPPSTSRPTASPSPTPTPILRTTRHGGTSSPTLRMSESFANLRSYAPALSKALGGCCRCRPISNLRRLGAEAKPILAVRYRPPTPPTSVSSPTHLQGSAHPNGRFIILLRKTDQRPLAPTPGHPGYTRKAPKPARTCCCTDEPCAAAATRQLRRRKPPRRQQPASMQAK